MPIINVTIFICENCGVSSVRSTEETQYNNIIIKPASGAVFLYFLDGKREKLVCGECYRKLTGEEV